MNDSENGMPLHLSVILASVMAAGGSSGLTLYMAPDVGNDPNARADPYTGKMHDQFSKYINDRFRKIDSSIEDFHQHIDEMRNDHSRILMRDGDCAKSLVELIEKYHGAR